MVPEIWAKMLLANQIAEFVNQIYISETERCDILDVDTNSWKSRVAWKILGYVVLLENSYAILSHGTLKSAVSQ